ncbi:MAG: anaerobic carbon-monoxide dehydrogenase catalytic subunit [Candidatus Omnitrophota bacterium]
MKPEDRSVDPATQHMLKKAADENIKVVWDRWDQMQPQCGFGKLGVCCKICIMGPCRIDPFGEGPQKGVCGATADTIVARNLARMIASGAAAHSDHGRDVAHAVMLLGQGKAPGYKIKSEAKLKNLAEFYGIDTSKYSLEKLAEEVGNISFSEFGSQHGPIKFVSKAPKKRQEIWKKLEVVPRGIDREVVELMHRTHIGVDNDYRNILLHGIRTSLADGWGGSMIATELQDIIFGQPEPIRAKVNLGVLKEGHVNIVVHGHEPTLSDVVAECARDPELLALAKKNGAKGINLVGMCCTANEILMRHGFPVAGDFLQQELAIMTGAVELMMVDVQCIMPALKDMTEHFHTILLTTSPKCKFPGVEHVAYKEEEAVGIAKNIIRMGVENYKKRDPSRVDIPKHEMDLIAGFSTENAFQFLGGRYRSTYRPLNDAIISGRLRGAAGVVGCNNPNIKHNWAHVEMVKELLKNDVLVVQTGCSALACAKAGFLTPEAAKEFAGPGLREICETVGIPPVLHLGSCVDNSRILLVLSEIVKEGGLGDDISDLPAAGAAPEWMSEKAVSIGFYFVGSGVYTVLGTPLPTLGSKNVTEYITKGIEEDFGGKFAFEADPVKAARMMIRRIDKKRKALNLKGAMYASTMKSVKA